MVSVSFVSTAFVCLFISFVLSEVFLKLKYPRVIGQILTGTILSLPIFSIFFQNDNIITLNAFADIGVIFLMLLTGLSLNIKKMREAERDSFLIAISCVFFPFFLGLATIRLLNYSWIESIIVGICLSLTAEGTTMEVLYDLKAMRTRLGSIIISTGILDDIFEFLFLSSMVVFVNKNSIDAVDMLTRLMGFIVIIYLLYKAMPFILKVVNKNHIEFSSFSLTILFGLLIAAIATEFHISIVIAALIAGAILNYTEHDNKEHKKTIKQLELVAFTLLVPFFFIKIGLSFDFTSFVHHLPLIILIIVVAILGKLVGAFAMIPFTNLNLRQMHIIGWAMNSRGLVELIIANFAYTNGLIPIEIFSALVAMAVITTLLFPISMKFLAKERSVWY